MFFSTSFFLLITIITKVTNFLILANKKNPLLRIFKNVIGIYLKMFVEYLKKINYILQNSLLFLKIEIRSHSCFPALSHYQTIKYFLKKFKYNYLFFMVHRSCHCIAKSKLLKKEQN